MCQVVRFGPDLDIMLLVILPLKTGWDSVRSQWALWRWRTGMGRPSWLLGVLLRPALIRA